MEQICYYIVARYIPDLVRGEFINIGVLLQSATTPFVSSKFLANYAPVKRFDPNVSATVLNDFALSSQNAAGAAARRRVGIPARPVATPPEFITTLSRRYAGVVQYDAPKAVLTNDPAETLNRLYQELVAPPTKTRRDTTNKAHYTAASLRRDMIARLQASPVLVSHVETKYKVKGSVNPWIFDAGLRNGALHIVQTLSFDVDTEEKQNRALIFKGKIDDARQANQSVGLNVYAVVLPPEEKNASGYENSLKLLNASEIKITPPDEVDEMVKALERQVQHP